MQMYSPKIDSKYFNVTIDGLDLIGRDFSPSESFNRRETSRHAIIGGTQNVMRTTYVPRDFTFTCKLQIDPLYPDIYDSTFELWMSKPVEVISRELGGGLFKAECKVKRIHETPAYITVEIQLIEIPEVKSNIPNDDFKVLTDKVTTSNTKKGKGKGTSKKGSNKSSKKTTKKTKKSTSKNKKKKGSKITKTK